MLSAHVAAVCQPSLSHLKEKRKRKKKHHTHVKNVTKLCLKWKSSLWLVACRVVASTPQLLVVLNGCQELSL